MENYRQQLNDLQTKVSLAVGELRAKHPNIVLNTYNDYQNSEIDEYLEVRNDLSGDTYDVHLLRVDDRGYHVVSVNDGNEHTIGLFDFASTIDVINVYEMLCEAIN